MVVLKLGGGALADAEGVQRALAVVRSAGGESRCVVVSALGGVTDALEILARAAARGHGDPGSLVACHRAVLAAVGLPEDLLAGLESELRADFGKVARAGRVEGTDLDRIMTWGERAAAHLVAAALRREGVDALALGAGGLGLLTTTRRGGAEPLPGAEVRLRNALVGVTGVPVVTGYLGRDREGLITTLGRHGSDITAALLARALGAREMQVWKGVAGVMTADPRLGARARLIPRLSFDQARALAASDPPVVHPRALELVAEAGIPVRVRDLAHPDRPGSLIAG